MGEIRRLEGEKKEYEGGWFKEKKRKQKREWVGEITEKRVKVKKENKWMSEIEKRREKKKQ